MGPAIENSSDTGRVSPNKGARRPIPMSMTDSESPIRLTDSHRRQIVEAGRRMRGIRRAISFARFHAAMIMFFGVVTLAVVAFQMALGDVDALHLLLGAGLVAVALNEFWGATQLERLQLRGPILLAAGEVALGFLIIAYCVWSLLHIEVDQASALGGTQMEQQLEEMLSGAGDMIKGLTALVYVVVIAATVLYQGLVSIYYLTRRWPIRKYVRQTPNWIVEFDRLRAGG